jgi:protein SCO1
MAAAQLKKLAALAVLGIAGCGSPEPLPVLSQVEPFALTREDGQPLTREALAGQVWVANFIFTNCAGPCPRMSTAMKRIQTAVEKYPEVRLVSFTVDPERDTPEVLAAYGKRYGAEPGRWYFATGDRETLHRLMRYSFLLGDVDGSLEHSTRFVLVDRQGRVRGYYSILEDDGPSRLVAAVGELARAG